MARQETYVVRVDQSLRDDLNQVAKTKSAETGMKISATNLVRSALVKMLRENGYQTDDTEAEAA